MNYTSRMKYGTSLANMFDWTQTTYLRGEYKFNNSYVDRLCNKLVSSPLIYSVFASIEKDRNEELDNCGACRKRGFCTCISGK